MPDAAADEIDTQIGPDRGQDCQDLALPCNAVTVRRGDRCFVHRSRQADALLVELNFSSN